ncbi:hypothetical protein BJ508DRAFT_315848 [Ascobolus immersus RN42]|uniref:Uncharacterized protein n=1 Tax=Ascobolus immersus RN42 TaxID=1160509 RepID=A0A3N4HGF3_ASCIM|nr:hypothetical protein BJ508DRAFT_315848 [Ascobolus immersus RN42]
MEPRLRHNHQEKTERADENKDRRGRISNGRSAQRHDSRAHLEYESSRCTIGANKRKGPGAYTYVKQETKGKRSPERKTVRGHSGPEKREVPSTQSGTFLKEVPLGTKPPYAPASENTYVFKRKPLPPHAPELETQKSPSLSVQVLLINHQEKGYA